MWKVLQPVTSSRYGCGAWVQPYLPWCFLEPVAIASEGRFDGLRTEYFIWRYLCHQQHA